MLTALAAPASGGVGVYPTSVAAILPATRSPGSTDPMLALCRLDALHTLLIGVKGAQQQVLATAAPALWSSLAQQLAAAHDVPLLSYIRREGFGCVVCF